MDDIDKQLLNDFQRGFSLSPEPYKEIADKIGIDQTEVLSRLQKLQEEGQISRIGAILKPGSVGASMLAALKTPAERIEEVAGFISSLEQVNHNYQREHDYNIWFVLNTSNQDELSKTVRLIEETTQLKVLALPMLQDFHLDLGFALKWH